MCGIAGLAGANDRNALERMTRALRHRGPDAEGFFQDEAGGVGLGHTRLSILDHSGGSQPMVTADGQLVVVFNGEIYNHREIRARLIEKGHRFRTDHSDTEVLLHGYRQWGRDLPEKLNGMWAFAIFDHAAGEFFLSRDRFGQKPLYYAFRNGRFAFASELTALVEHGGLAVSISPQGLRKYFGYGFIPAPHTFYDRVLKLPAGCNLRVDTSDLSHSVTCYWDYLPEPVPVPGPTQEEEWCEQLRELLRQAVGRRLEADVPLGVFLSGGIDSGSVTACAAEALGSGGSLRTFSIGFDESSFDETPYFERVARRFGTLHQSSTVSQRVIRERWASMVAGMDEPMGDCSFLPTYILCEETRRQVTVALGGDGADELFAGYDPFRALRWADWYARLAPRPVHAGIRMAAGLLPVSFRNFSLEFRIKKTLQGLGFPRRLWNPVWLSPLEPREIGELLGTPVDPEDLYSEAIACWEGCAADSLVDRTIQFFIKLYLQDDILTKVDRAGMLHSLEVRSPFLDIDLVNFVRRLPWQVKCRRGCTKYLLKKALEPMLPKDVIHRPKKGFGVPLAEWFRNWEFDLEGLPAEIDRAEVRRRIAEHRAKRRNDRLFLWNTVLLSAYCARPPA